MGILYVPSTISYNMNVTAGIRHHSEGHLVWRGLAKETIQEVNAIAAHRQQSRTAGIIILLRLPVSGFVRMTSLCGHPQSHNIPTSGFIPRREANEPRVITLPQGKTLLDQRARQRHEIVSLGTIPSALAIDATLPGGTIRQQRRRSQVLT